MITRLKQVGKQVDAQKTKRKTTINIDKSLWMNTKNPKS